MTNVHGLVHCTTNVENVHGLVYCTTIVESVHGLVHCTTIVESVHGLVHCTTIVECSRSRAMHRSSGSNHWNQSTIVSVQETVTEIIRSLHLNWQDISRRQINSVEATPSMLHQQPRDLFSKPAITVVSVHTILKVLDFLLGVRWVAGSVCWVCLFVCYCDFLKASRCLQLESCK